MKTSSEVIEAVRYWLEHTIIGFNFCPFARKPFVNNSVHYEVAEQGGVEDYLALIGSEIERLDEHAEIETSLVIFPSGLESFFDDLDFLYIANQLIADLGYEGVYQLASFHPDYCFEDVEQLDVSNFTNRSPFPIIHIIREEQLEKAISQYPNPEQIPDQNIKMTQERGSSVFLEILKHCRQKG